MSISISMFSTCISLTEVVIPSNIKIIGWNAFGSCYSLTTVRMEEGVETIGGEAFMDCSNLTDVYIPRSVISIDDTVFHFVDATTQITIHGYAGSYAETYAIKSNINFEVIEE